MQKTQTISVRELRQNLSLYLRATQLKKIHFVVMRHAEPIARIVPEKPKKKTRKQLKEELLRDIREAQAQMDRGEYYTQEEMEELLRRRSGSSTRNGRARIPIVFPKPSLRGSFGK